jgi:OmpA-OmpF porin, OOP family
MNTQVASLAFAILIVMSPHAFGQQAAYKSEDIIKFFGTAQAPATRGICVGDDVACGVKKQAGPVTAFDLLITFEKNSADLTDSAQNNLLQFSAALRHPKLVASRFAVEGFTDASGSDDHNMVLSQQRAQSVVAFLTELGIEPHRLEASGFGETRMRMPDVMDAGNRRVETHIIAE